MKKLLALAILTATAFTNLFAQDNKNGVVDKLVNDKNFVFVTTKVERKAGLNGSSGYAPYTSVGNINSGVVSIATSLALTSQTVGASGYAKEQYYSQLSGDGSYFTAYNINQNGKKSNQDVSEPGSVFLIQYPDQFMIRGGGNPATVEEANNTEFRSFLTGGYKVTSSKKSKGKWSLVYNVGQGDGLRKYYLDVFDDGRAIFKAQPNKDFTTVLYGFIISPTQLASNKTDGGSN